VPSTVDWVCQLNTPVNGITLRRATLRRWPGSRIGDSATARTPRASRRLPLAHLQLFHHRRAVLSATRLFNRVTGRAYPQFGWDDGVREADKATVRAPTLAFLCVLLALCDATPADAQMLRCASKHLTPSDRIEAFARARPVLPANGGRLLLDSSCWNVDFAVAWFQTPTAVEADDVQWWWSIRCERRVRSWACEPASRNRQVETNIAVNGKTRKVSGSLPEGISGRRGRALIGTATTLVVQPQMPFASCTAGEDQVMWSRYHRQEPQSDAEESASVDLTDSGPVVDVYRWSMRIQFDKDDHPVCWDAYVVVT
jgi:hypothetical protein